MTEQTSIVEERFFIFTEKATGQKALLEQSKARIQLNDTFMNINKQLREVIKLNNPEFSIKMQRFCLQFTKEVYGRDSDMQSLLLLNKVEEQVKLVQQPEKYLKDVEHALGLKGASLLKKEPDDIVEQFAKRQRANLVKFSGFESPAEKQFMILQKDMTNGLLQGYKLLQRKALGIQTPEKSVQRQTKDLGL